MLDADVEVDRREFTVRARLQVAPGERLALFGPSGAGKTTLLEVIAGLVAPRLGRIELGDRVLTSTAPPVRAVPPWQRRVGLLRQDPGCSRTCRCGTTCATPPRRRLQPPSCPRSLRPSASRASCRRCPRACLAARRTGWHSAACSSRTVTRSCSTSPTRASTPALRRTLTDLVGSLVAERSIPAVLVAHELADAQAFADRLAVIDRGELLQIGEPNEIVLRPRLAPGRGTGRLPRLRTQRGQGSGDSSRTGDGWSLCRPRTRADRSKVAACRPAGAGWEADLRVGDTSITCRLSDKPLSADGEFIVTALDPPYFGSNGVALLAAPADGRRGTPEEVNR